MQHGGDADLGAQMFAIGGNRKQCFRCRLEQRVVDHRLVGVGDAGDLRRQREDNMIVRHGQQLGPARLQPIVGRRRLAFGAMPVTAGIVGDVEVAAVLATHDVAAERCRAAGFDGRHHAELAQA